MNQADVSKTPMTELNCDLAVAQAIALIKSYSFDTNGTTAEKLVQKWLNNYQGNWVRLAAIEALYLGRYKAVSIEQIMEVWLRIGTPNIHFKGEFERLICRKLPKHLIISDSSWVETEEFLLRKRLKGLNETANSDEVGACSVVLRRTTFDHLPNRESSELLTKLEQGSGRRLEFPQAFMSPVALFLDARSLAAACPRMGETAAGVEGELQNQTDNSWRQNTKFRKVPLPAHRFSGGVLSTSESSSQAELVFSDNQPPKTLSEVKNILIQETKKQKRGTSGAASVRFSSHSSHLSVIIRASAHQEKKEEQEKCLSPYSPLPSSPGKTQTSDRYHLPSHSTRITNFHPILDKSSFFDKLKSLAINSDRLTVNH